MKLEVGMYVRTIGGIERLKKENDNGWFFEKSMIIKPDNIEKYIIKASYNIIDILEVGDAIEIDVIDKDNYPTIMGINFARIDNKVELASIKDMLKNESAKLLTVITHEQMEQMAYKVGE